MKTIRDSISWVLDWLEPGPEEKLFHIPLVDPRSPALRGHRAVDLCIDVSGSMAFTDYSPSRLNGAVLASKRYCKVLAAREPDTLVGLVAFSDEALVHCPLVPVRERQATLLAALRGLEISGGTHIGDGLKLAGHELARVPSPVNPTIILLTDGESNGGADPLVVARDLKRRGVQLDIIGIGGSPEDVNEPDLKRMASIVDEKVRYWFIDSVDELVQRFEVLALREIK